MYIMPYAIMHGTPLKAAIISLLHCIRVDMKICKKHVKGTSHNFSSSGKPIDHFQKKGKIHMKQIKNITKPCKIA